MVPPPHERPGLIQKVHSKLGHFRVKRTYSLLASLYHWRSMYAEVRDIIARCEQCGRVRNFSPLDNSHFLHSLFKACSIVGHVI
jgi:hypothetical protein